MTATKGQALAAVRALGYDPDADSIMSFYGDTDQIVVRRIEKTDTGWAVVEDVTILRPDRAPARQRPDGELGPLRPPPAPILSPDCRDDNHTKCNTVAWDEARDAPTECQCRDLAHGTNGEPHG